MNTRSQSQSLASRVAALPSLPMSELWALWDKYFPRRPAHHHRDFVQARVAYCMQQQELGGIESDVRRQLVRIGEYQSQINPRSKTETHVIPGTQLIREYDNREHRVIATADGSFEYEGKQFKSLSAAARFITGSQWSGPLFFGLVKTQRRAK